MSSHGTERVDSLRELMSRSEKRSYSWVKRLQPAYILLREEYSVLRNIDEIGFIYLNAICEPHTKANHALLTHLETCGVSDRAGEIFDALWAVARPRVDGKIPLGQNLTVGDLWLLKDKELKRLSLRDPEIRIVRRLFPKPKSL